MTTIMFIERHCIEDGHGIDEFGDTYDTIDDAIKACKEQFDSMLSEMASHRWCRRKNERAYAYVEAVYIDEDGEIDCMSQPWDELDERTRDILNSTDCYLERLGSEV